jgi:Holliday junction resolvase YEN1
VCLLGVSYFLTSFIFKILRPAATTRSLTDLAIKEGFEANLDGRRGFRLGIDASIWFFHAEYGKEGENPVLRTLFFRCATLMRTTFLPIFIFDGPKRPDIKRGKKINKTSNKLIPGMKQIVEAFGFEWRTVSDFTRCSVCIYTLF